MPLLSIVLVAAGGQPGVQEGAAALLGPELAGVELVEIDDAGAPHAARNLGLERATGEYVWFIEPGWPPPPGTLAGAGELLRAARPDVLLLDRGRHPRLLARVAEDGTTTLERRRGLPAAAPHAADKIFRREHLLALGVRFGAGTGGELPVTWPALLAAERIAAAPGVRASADADTGGEARDVFAHYDSVFAFIAAQPDLLEARRRLVLPAMLRRELTRLDRLPGSERPAFVAELSAAWQRHRRGDETLRGRVAALQARLVERGDHRGLRALSASLRARRALARRRAGAKRRARRALRAARERRLERHYRACLRRPVDPDLAVFAAYWYRGYACNPRAIYEKARELVPGMRGVWVVRPDGVDSVPAGVEHVVRGTREYYEAIARARILVNNVNFPNHLVKREGTLHVMTHHGTPLKRMGMDLADTPITGARMDFDALLRRCERWDFSISSNHFSTEIWERVYPTSYESLEVGYPRNDVLVNAGADDVRRARDELGLAPGQTAVLYAPTHREYRSTYVPVLDVAAVAESLGPGYVLLARAHYFYDADRSLRELHRQGRVRDVASHPSVEQLCIAADVLLTDYSSIMFDYAVLDRPIVIHAPDWELYRALRGTYFDLMAEPPGLVTRTEREIVEGFRAGAVADEATTRARAAFRERFCALEDGRAAERVVRRVWLGEREPTGPRPSPVAR
jgi:CDP-glycerol glycerophosphotransferase